MNAAPGGKRGRGEDRGQGVTGCAVVLAEATPGAHTCRDAGFGYSDGQLRQYSKMIRPPVPTGWARTSPNRERRRDSK